jgi:hypothetical protein
MRLEHTGNLEAHLHALTSALDAVRWSVSFNNRFALHIKRVGDGWGPWANLGEMTKRKIPALAESRTLVWNVPT